jgi:hypothetical protein
MLKISTVLLAAGIIGSMTAAANAHGVDSRLERQAAAIEAGRKAGSITWTEGIKLRSEQRRIARLKKRYTANDGRLSATEKRILNKKLRTARQNIKNEKRDSLKRWSGLPRVGR